MTPSLLKAPQLLAGTRRLGGLRTCEHADIIRPHFAQCFNNPYHGLKGFGLRIILSYSFVNGY